MGTQIFARPLDMGTQWVHTADMTNQEIKDTVRQMLSDWNAATPEQRQAALEQAALLAAIKDGSVNKGAVLFNAALTR
ncbi:MAG TPA: hypothetical protein VLT87_10860 [Thermoanaerobaculia bacterium]|nr:hypothetical protein [Thermoanaerobaculia bacterium]